MMNKRAMKALSEIMEYLDGEEVEAMKGSDLMGDMGEGGEKEAGVTVVKVEKEEEGPEMGEGEDSDICPECGSKTLGGTFCPGCGKRLKGGTSGGGY